MGGKGAVKIGDCSAFFYPTPTTHQKPTMTAKAAAGNWTWLVEFDRMHHCQTHQLRSTGLHYSVSTQNSLYREKMSGGMPGSCCFTTLRKVIHHWLFLREGKRMPWRGTCWLFTLEGWQAANICCYRKEIVFKWSLKTHLLRMLITTEVNKG